MVHSRFKRGLPVLIVLGFVAGPAFAAPVKILMLGTSLIEGYGLPPGAEIPALPQAKLKTAKIDAKALNGRVSGDTSAGGSAKQCGATLYTFVPQGVALNPKLNKRDGMQPNPAGAKIIAKCIFLDVKMLVAQVQHAPAGSE